MLRNAIRVVIIPAYTVYYYYYVVVVLFGLVQVWKASRSAWIAETVLRQGWVPKTAYSMIEHKQNSSIKDNTESRLRVFRLALKT